MHIPDKSHLYFWSKDCNCFITYWYIGNINNRGTWNRVEWLETSWATWQSIVGEEETCDRTGGGVWRWTTWLDSSHGVMLNSVSPHSLWHMGIQYLFWGVCCCCSWVIWDISQKCLPSPMEPHNRWPKIFSHPVWWLKIFNWPRSICFNFINHFSSEMIDYW